MTPSNGNRNIIFIIMGITAAVAAAWVTIRWRLS